MSFLSKSVLYLRAHLERLFARDPSRRYSKGYPAVRDIESDSPPSILSNLTEADEHMLRLRYGPQVQLGLK
jgi:hypothetical protein